MQIIYEFIKNEQGEDMLNISFDEESTNEEKANAIWFISAVTSPAFPDVIKILEENHPEVYKNVLKIYENEAPVIDSEKIFHER